MGILQRGDEANISKAQRIKWIEYYQSAFKIKVFCVEQALSVSPISLMISRTVSMNAVRLQLIFVICFSTSLSAGGPYTTASGW